MTSITVPNGVRRIYVNAFSNLQGVTNVNIASSVKIIDNLFNQLSLSAYISL